MENTSLLSEGLWIAVIGISVVFLGLVILFIFIKTFVYFLGKSSSKKRTEPNRRIVVSGSGKESVSGEILAAISLAIHQSREAFHDMEQTIITLNRITRPYSPWSSKIHSIRKSAR